MDVDGTLTDGKIYIGANGELMKAFNIKDGYGIHDILPKLGVIPVIITGRKSVIVENRCKELGITHLYQGVNDKRAILIDFLSSYDGIVSEVAFIGDDLNDIPCIQLVKEGGGLIGAPSNACSKIHDLSDFVSSAQGGEGAVRDFIEYIVNSYCR